MGSLNLPQIAENQASAYVTSNDADAVLEKALCNSSSVHDASGGNFSLPETLFRENWFHTVGGTPGSGLTMTIPAISRPFMIRNISGQSVTVSTGGGDNVVVPASELRLLHCDGTHVRTLTDISGGGGGSAAFSGCLVSLSGSQSIPNTTVSTLSWGTENRDTDNFHSNSVNPSRLIVPVGVSTVILRAQVRWDSNVAGERQVLFLKNGSSSYPGRAFAKMKDMSELMMTLVSPPLAVSSGDYFELAAWQNSGGSRTVEQHDTTWFSLQALS